MNHSSDSRSEKGSILVRAITRASSQNINLMEVCGTHTVSIFRHGLRTIIPENIKMISGPGCPVCVTDQGDIDAALELAEEDMVTMATYGDMLRVPGTSTSLADLKARGRDIRIITSASQCIEIAEKDPQKEIVFFSVGFETTAPATASMLLEAQKKGLENLSVISLHKRTPPVLETLASDPGIKIDGFILPGHVSVILGHDPYRSIPERYGIPSCITGFEPEDILSGIFSIVRQIEEGKPRLTSVYGRVVKKEGNIKAKELMAEVFEYCDARWRGIGEIKSSGLAIKEKYRKLDAQYKWNLKTKEVEPPAGCRCGDVLSGRITPPECPLFRTVCTPSSPVGPCMASSEGSCSAYYRFRGGAESWNR